MKRLGALGWLVCLLSWVTALAGNSADPVALTHALDHLRQGSPRAS